MIIFYSLFIINNQKFNQTLSIILTKGKVTENFCITGDFFKEYSKEIKKYKTLPVVDYKNIENRVNTQSSLQPFPTANKLMSRLFTECVSEPTEIKSTPVSA